MKKFSKLTIFSLTFLFLVAITNSLKRSTIYPEYQVPITKQLNDLKAIHNEIIGQFNKLEKTIKDDKPCLILTEQEKTELVKYIKSIDDLIKDLPNIKNDEDSIKKLVERVNNLVTENDKTKKDVYPKILEKADTGYRKIRDYQPCYEAGKQIRTALIVKKNPKNDSQAIIFNKIKGVIDLRLKKIEEYKKMGIELKDRR